MIDHVTLRVSNIARSRAFYEKALAPLGFKVLMEFNHPEAGSFLGMGNGKPELWLATANKEHITPFGMHVALAAGTRAQVDQFHAAALAAGATDDGAAGPRAEYHPNYYGAFVIDPDGIRFEVCKHSPE